MILQQYLTNLRHIDWKKVPKAYSLVTVNSDGLMLGHAFDAVPVIRNSKEWHFECPLGGVILGRCEQKFATYQEAYIVPTIDEYYNECFGEEILKAVRY